MRTPEIDQDRCLRYRCRSSTCTRCRDACPLDCIQFSSGPVVNAGVCTGCLMCVAACPVDGMTVSGPHFPILVSALQALEQPVLGCEEKLGTNAHRRVACLGVLSENHLTSLAVLLPYGVQFNAVPCRDCDNSFILPVLEERVAVVSSLLPREFRTRLHIVYDPEDLKFSEHPVDRRTFFRTFGREVISTAADLVNARTASSKPARSEKFMPVKRELVNRAAASLPETDGKRLLSRFNHDFHVEDTCTGCPRCSAVCPTGALTRSPEESAEILNFEPGLCAGCGVCVDFCPFDSLSLIDPGDKQRSTYGQAILGNSSGGSRERSGMDQTESI